jgi:hypothetical protein
MGTPYRQSPVHARHVPADQELLRWLAWREGDDDAATGDRWAEYHDTLLPAMLERFPGALREFADPDVGPELLHDAYVVELRERAPGAWTLVALCPNSRGEHECRLEVRTTGANLIGIGLDQVPELLTNPGAGLDYTEFAIVGDDRYELRISRWDGTGPSFGLRFAELEFEIEPVAAGTCLSEVERRAALSGRGLRSWGARAWRRLGRHPR